MILALGKLQCMVSEGVLVDDLGQVRHMRGFDACS